MSTFEVPILAIDDVYDHPNADRLSIIRVRGYEAISAKLEDGSWRTRYVEAQPGRLQLLLRRLGLIELIAPPAGRCS